MAQIFIDLSGFNMNRINRSSFLLSYASSLILCAGLARYSQDNPIIGSGQLDAGMVLYTVLTLVFLFSIPLVIKAIVNRAHDCGYSGFSALLAFIPLFNIVYLLVLLCKGSEKNNRYGQPDNGLYLFGYKLS